jgi:hypothetical protein
MTLTFGFSRAYGTRFRTTTGPATEGGGLFSGVPPALCAGIQLFIQIRTLNLSSVRSTFHNLAQRGQDAVDFVYRVVVDQADAQEAAGFLYV